MASDAQRCELCRQPHSRDYEAAGRLLAAAIAAALPCLAPLRDREPCGSGDGILAEVERQALALAEEVE